MEEEWFCLPAENSPWDRRLPSAHWLLRSPQVRHGKTIEANEAKQRLLVSPWNGRTGRCAENCSKGRNHDDSTVKIGAGMSDTLTSRRNRARFSGRRYVISEKIEADWNCTSNLICELQKFWIWCTIEEWKIAEFDAQLKNEKLLNSMHNWRMENCWIRYFRYFIRLEWINI